MEKRIEESPDDANLHNDFGNLLALRQFPEQAAEQYELAAKLDSANFISLYNLGLLRETEGKPSDAISAYKKSIARKPGFPPSRFRLGRLYEKSGKIGRRGRAVCEGVLDRSVDARSQAQSARHRLGADRTAPRSPNYDREICARDPRPGRRLPRGARVPAGSRGPGRRRRRGRRRASPSRRRARSGREPGASRAGPATGGVPPGPANGRRPPPHPIGGCADAATADRPPAPWPASGSAGGGHARSPREPPPTPAPEENEPMSPEGVPPPEAEPTPAPPEEVEPS